MSGTGPPVFTASGGPTPFSCCMTDEAGSRSQKRCRDRGGALPPPLAGRVGERVSPQRDIPPEERTIARRAGRCFASPGTRRPLPQAGEVHRARSGLFHPISSRSREEAWPRNRCQLSTTRRLPSKSRKTGSGFSPFAPCLARHPRLLTPPTTGALLLPWRLQERWQSG